MNRLCLDLHDNLFIKKSQIEANEILIETNKVGDNAIYHKYMANSTYLLFLRSIKKQIMLILPKKKSL